MSADLIGALNCLSSKIYKILLVNLTSDSFKIIKCQSEDRKIDTDSFSAMMKSYADYEDVFESDIPRYTTLTTLEFLRNYFKENDSFQIRYRRSRMHEFRWTALRMMKHEDYTDSSQLVYLYVLDNHDEPPAQQGTKLQEFNILKSLAKMYVCMHLFDLRENKIFGFGEPNVISRHRDLTKSPCMQLKDIIRGTVIESYQQKLIAFTNLSTLSERLNGKKVISTEFIGRFYRWCRAQFVVIATDKSGRPYQVVLTIAEINDEKKRIEALEALSNTDELTRTYNRRAFDEDSKYHTVNLRTENIALLSVDINGLKQVNDSLGHTAGDELIVGAASVLTKAFDGIGKVYRMGGDEFCILCSLPKDAVAAHLKELEQSMRQWHGLLNDRLNFSIGCANSLDYNCSSIDELYRYSDLEMYKNKTRFYKENSMERRIV